MFIKKASVQAVMQRKKITNSLFALRKKDIKIAQNAEIIIHVMFTVTVIMPDNVI